MQEGGKKEDKQSLACPSARPSVFLAGVKTQSGFPPPDVDISSTVLQSGGGTDGGMTGDLVTDDRKKAVQEEEPSELQLHWSDPCFYWSDTRFQLV